MGVGKKVDCASDAEATDYNHKAAKSSAARTSSAYDMETDYSIPGKKRGSYKQDAD